METNLLLNLGLTKDEATIYNVLLEGGYMPARGIAMKANIGRPLTYKILDDLIIKGIVEKKDVTNKIALFSPVHPKELEKLLEKKEEEIENTKKVLNESLGQMISKYNLFVGKPNVQFFEGDRGITEVLKDSLNAKETILEYVDNEIAKDYIPKENEEYVKERIKKGIKKKMLSPESDYIKERVKKMNPEFSELKIMKGIKPFNTALQIYNNKISYITLKDNKKIGIIIEDEDIAKMHKTIFNQNWENGEKLI